MQTGSVPDSGHLGPPPVSPAGHGEGIEGKLMQWERCDASVAMLIFAPGATELARFEDYARLMYPEYTRLNLPTWIIGPSLGGSSMENRSADIFQVWPVRGSMERMQPDEFNIMVLII